ncbi:hypothetical protein BCV69DRAFT_310561 [Microstroma glucosiphilum]|uniref:Uncharacterized protein n=1 Tax=Pseudomicrostroma glucosiphilum TaxID=1684307 RepID=A0A316UF84_9BASI|nr:hypothetical protein BCV69DRAFT_310561 [Pseudomicrostroma glucosiphilum]PWN23071.1 hypothetical protein BCV69DRAFT_310561 [Pseudomicrostroma glucosiphilum]
MNSLNYVTPTMPSNNVDDWPQDVQQASKWLRSQAIHIRAPSEAMPGSGVDFFRKIDALPKTFAAYETFEQLSAAVEQLPDEQVKKAWQRATSSTFTTLPTGSGQGLPEWLRLVNYPTLNAVFGEAEMNGLITSSTKRLWFGSDEPSFDIANEYGVGPYSNFYMSRASRTEVVYGLAYGRSWLPNGHEMPSPRNWDPLSRRALDRLRQHLPSFYYSPRSNDEQAGPLFPGIIYAAQASETDMFKGEIQAAAAAAKALQVLEALMRTSDSISSSPVVAIIVSAGPLWRLHFATSTVIGRDPNNPSYDIYRSRKLDLYIDDASDRLRLHVILGNLEQWLRVTHGSWVRRHVSALWTSYLEACFGSTVVDLSGDDEEAAEEIYVEDSEGEVSEAGSSEANDWMGQDWGAGPGEAEDWVTQIQLASLQTRLSASDV